MSRLRGRARKAARVSSGGVKLLLDENLSPRLLAFLQDKYPGSQHVEALLPRGSSDGVVWEAAATFEYITGKIARLLNDRVFDVQQFASDSESAFLILTLVASER